MSGRRRSLAPSNTTTELRSSPNVFSFPILPSFFVFFFIILIAFRFFGCESSNRMHCTEPCLEGSCFGLEPPQRLVQGGLQLNQVLIHIVVFRRRHVSIIVRTATATTTATC